jgi:hypothetical protein
MEILRYLLDRKANQAKTTDGNSLELLRILIFGPPTSKATNRSREMKHSNTPKPLVQLLNLYLLLWMKTEFLLILKNLIQKSLTINCLLFCEFCYE